MWHQEQPWNELAKDSFRQITFNVNWSSSARWLARAIPSAFNRICTIPGALILYNLILDLRKRPRHSIVILSHSHLNSMALTYAILTMESALKCDGAAP
jgi:hypothetical protein